MTNQLGEFLEKLRGKMSLRLAAEKSGISHTYIRDIEKGVDRRSGAPIKPSPDTLKALSTAYDFPYVKLLEIAGIIDDDSESSDIDVIEAEVEDWLRAVEQGKLGIGGKPVSKNKQLLLRAVFNEWLEGKDENK